VGALDEKEIGMKTYSIDFIPERINFHQTYICIPSVNNTAVHFSVKHTKQAEDNLPKAIIVRTVNNYSFLIDADCSSIRYR